MRMAELLTEQLREAEADGGDPLELAAIAGLLLRTGVDAHDTIRPLPDDTLEDVDYDALVDAIADLDQDTEPEVVADRLFALDEVCAAAAFLGRVPDDLAAAVDLVTRVARAFPESVVSASTLATEILARHPPVPGDPSWAMWAAVEASVWVPSVDPTP